MTQRNATQRALDAPITEHDTPAAKSPYGKPSKTGVLRVKRVRVQQNKTYGHRRFELETNQPAPNDVIHLDSHLEAKLFKQMIELCPAIDALTWNDTTKRSLVLAHFWDVAYKRDMRALGPGMRECMIATKIVETNKSTEDTPAIEPNTAAATVLMEAYEAAQKKAAETPKDPTLDCWFPRDKDGKPLDDPRTDELNAMLEGLTGDAPDEGDELTAPVWTGASLTGIAAEKAIFHHFTREIVATEPPGSVSNHLLVSLNGIPLGSSIEKIGAAEVCKILQTYINNLRISNKANSAPEPTLPAIGVHEMQTEAPSAQKSSEKQASVSALPEAPFSANFKLTDKHGIDIQFTIRAASGKEGIPQIDAAIEYLLANGYTTRAQAAQALPPNATPIGSAPSAQSSSSGQSPCMMIKVARSYTGNKPQLEFEVDGFENPIRFTSDNPGKLAAALKGIRKPDGSEFTAADMTDGRKFGGNWLLSWEKRQKDDKTYTNFVTIAAA